MLSLLSGCKTLWRRNCEAFSKYSANIQWYLCMSIKILSGRLTCNQKRRWDQLAYTIRSFWLLDEPIKAQSWTIFCSTFQNYNYKTHDSSKQNWQWHKNLKVSAIGLACMRYIHPSKELQEKYGGTAIEKIAWPQDCGTVNDEAPFSWE